MRYYQLLEGEDDEWNNYLRALPDTRVDKYRNGFLKYFHLAPSMAQRFPFKINNKSRV